MKRFCSVLLILGLLLSLCACRPNEPVQDNEIQHTTTAPPTTPPETIPTDPEEIVSSITPILYQVTDAAGNKAWLFGSIHVGQEDYYPLPDYITTAYENSDALAVECDVMTFSSSMKAQVTALMKLIYRDGTTIADHIPEDLYTQAVDTLKECSLYMSALDMYYPALWATYIESSLYENMEFSSDLGIDMHFLSNAHENGKEILEVESPEFQYAMLAGFSEELQILLLESALYSYNHMDETATGLTELTDAWAFGNEEALVELLNDQSDITSEEETLLYEEYTDAMLTQRNISMADFVETALTSGKEVFICVGAAHVVGPGAMADLLTQRGYTVERIEV